MALSTDQNPYESVEVKKVSVKVPCASGRELLSLANWQNYFAILGVASVVICAAILFYPLLSAKENDVGHFIILVQLGIPYFLFATLVFVVPSILLFKAASVSKRCVFDEQELSRLIIVQRNAWRYLALLAALFLVTLVIVFVYNIS